MQAFTHFSPHAFMRIAQRTKLSCQEIARILDQKLALNIGRKPGSNRNHLLFYSSIDDDFFVAIQDGQTGSVVTVLPLPYHANLAWKVSFEDCNKAKELFLSYEPEVIPVQKTSHATKFIVNGHYLDDNQNQKTKLIEKRNSEPYNNDMKRLLAERSLFQELYILAAERGINTQRMFGISFRLGSHGAPVFFELAPT